jgi:hypothetical protein
MSWFFTETELRDMRARVLMFGTNEINQETLLELIEQLRDDYHDYHCNGCQCDNQHEDDR